MKYLVYFNADEQPGRAIVTLQNVDAFTEKGVYFIEEQMIGVIVIFENI